MDIANFLPTSAEYVRLLPEIVLTLVGDADRAMFLEAVLKDDQKGIFPPLTISGSVVGAGAGAWWPMATPDPRFKTC